MTVLTGPFDGCECPSHDARIEHGADGRYQAQCRSVQCPRCMGEATAAHCPCGYVQILARRDTPGGMVLVWTEDGGLAVGEACVRTVRDGD